MKTALLPCLALTAALGACVVHPSPGGGPGRYVPPAIDQQISTRDKRDRIRVTSRAGAAKDPRKVRVCLDNTASGRNKGIHWKAGGKPRYIARKRGDVVCGEHPTGNRVVRWYLFKTKGIGMKVMAAYDLNVRGREGQQITFSWNGD